MLSAMAPLLAALFLPSGLTFPYPFTNSSAPTNRTGLNNTTPNPNNTTPIEYQCQVLYPNDLTVLNERYPDYNSSHLHDANRLFMLRREIPIEGEIATRVQFQGLPPKASNTTCRLEFILPQPDLQVIEGFNPTFDVFQVERDTETTSTWRQYVGNSGAELFGRVNGEAKALEKTRKAGGIAAINSTQCNETMTFQMGMAFNSRDGVPNYWYFVQSTLAAWPLQGFRMVWGC
ncbi:hypothetical protein DE146DRAFT_625887 [Phaeosphaeria sp. MPI-PUGE-AT-0046c]|nr:hypothetical protein DE146DRAFT_625887 [Phaeosphaeria sp. MPI-PUGE-AT-0046c]